MKKQSKKYVSVASTNGLDYNQISDYMTKRGDTMNHSTARNLVVRSFIKIAENLTKKYGIKLNHEQLLDIAINNNFQESIIDLIKEREKEVLDARKKNM